MASIRRPSPLLPDSVFDMFNMRGRVVIITGGSGGIGYQIGRAVAEVGANVALWYDRSTQTEQLAAALASDFGITAKAYKCSVQNFDQVCVTVLCIRYKIHELCRSNPPPTLSLLTWVVSMS